MEEQNLQNIITTIWPRLKKKHLYPEIPIPKIGEIADFIQDESSQKEWVGMEMKKKQMIINPVFISHLKNRMPEAQAIEALLDHGISHYTFCPWDFHTHIMLYMEAKKVTGNKELAKKVTDYFIDIVADTYCVKNRDTKIPELHRHLEKGRVEEIFASLFQKIWGIDLGIPNPEKNRKENQEIVRRLARIPYLDRSRWHENIQKFARSIKDLLIEKEMEQNNQGGKGNSNPLGEHDFDNYAYEEIDQGLRDYAKERMGLAEFKEVVEDFSEELMKAGYRTETGMGRGQGSPIDAEILFYMKLAENYSIPVKKISLENIGSMHPYSHSPWEVGSPIQDVDIWTSFGKIMPGVTQIWNKKLGKGRRNEEGTPDCLIAIDTSGSMINPRKNLSYAVLGAGCATDAYLRNGSKVGVYNFSDAPMGGKEILDYTDRRENIYRVLCKYFGGGTALELEDLIPLTQGKKNLDFFIITDMKITNLETLIGYLSKIQNRITAVHIGENPYAVRFEKAVEKKKNINIFKVKRKEDIPRIVLGKINEYLNPTHLTQ